MATRSRVLLMVVSLLCTLLVVSVHSATPAAASGNQNAPLSSTAVATVNMQGASTTVNGTATSTGTTRSKWSETVRGLIQTNNIVLLQEAGPSGPPNPDDADGHDNAPHDTITTDTGDTIQHFIWNVGTERVGGSATGVSLAQVYFLQTDDNGGTAVGGRVNIGIVTRDVPDDFMVVRNPNDNGRAALGVRFGNNWYFTVHGLAFGGSRPNDSAALLEAIASDVALEGASDGRTYTYTVGGDFNQTPATLTDQGIPGGARILNPHAPTHISGNELDYFVTNDPTSPPVLPNGYYAQAENLGLGDHAAVRMGALRAAAGTPSLKVMFQAQKCGPNLPIQCPSDRTPGLGKATLGVFMAGVIALGSIFSRSVTFVGDDTTTSPDGTPEEGSNGEEISADASEDTTAIAQYMPNVVMLQAGTEDLLNGGAASAPGQLSALIDQIQQADPTAVVLVAPLDPMANSTDEALVTAYNTAVKQLVAAKAAAGRRVVLADTSALTTADLNADGVTPNASGQQKLASAFAGALLAAEDWGWITDPVPTSAPSGSVCDIYAYYGTPCVGAYSMTRAMFSDYDGPLYEVQRASDGQTQDIGLLSPGGDVDASQQDSFCANTACTVIQIYDQSYQLNNLDVAPGGGANPNPDQAADANALQITIGGNKAYGLSITPTIGSTPGVGYRNNNTRGVATDNAAAGVHMAEGMYMVASGTNVNSGCCFDFGNAETTSSDTGEGSMDAVNLSTTCYYQSSQGPCTGSGPWVEADLENGLFQGANGTNTGNTGNSSNFVTAMLKNNATDTYAVKGGDAQSGGLTTYWNGALPSVPGQAPYKPMQKQGAIILGTGGDNSNWDVGSFFEGAMTMGYPSVAADAAVQANIVAAGYKGSSNPTSNDVSSAVASAAGPAVVHSAGATGAGAAGFSSVYTVDSANGHLQESYLPYMGDSWSTQDLSSNAPQMAQTPAVLAGTKPVALVHCGYTSVFTVDAGDGGHKTGDLQETFLPAIGDPIGWRTQDLSQKYGAPPTNVTPTAVEHYAGISGTSPGCGFTSVYTVARNGNLWETYLPNHGFPGDAWLTQDLSSTNPTMPDTPQVLAGTSPVALVHCGYTSVYTVDATNHHLQESFLDQVPDSWGTQDLSRNYGTAGATTFTTPPTSVTPTAVMHSAGASGGTQDCGYTSVFTVDDVTQHLQENYLPNGVYGPNDPWHSQDLTTISGGPAVAPGTAPVALVHMGFTSVYTVAEGSMHLQETYLPYIGYPQNWQTHDLSSTAPTMPNTPATDQTPIVLLHPDESGNMDWVSVFTIDEFSNHLNESFLSNVGFPGDAWKSQDLSTTAPTMPNTPPVAVLQSSQSTWSLAHDGVTSAFTVDSNGDLQESWLTAMGATWQTHNLSSTAPTMADTPVVATSTVPTALYHQGYTSVYTVDAGDSSHRTGDLQETYLDKLGDSWVTQDLSSTNPNMAGTPTVAARSDASAVFHDGTASVYTIDAGDSNHHAGDLQETSLAAIGGPWVTADLSSIAGTPPAAPNTSPVAIVHDGYTSVFTVDQNGHLWETYLPFLGGPWLSHDLTAMTSGPVSLTTPTAVYHNGYASVFTVDLGDSSHGTGDLQETYVPAIGDSWVTQDLTAKYQVPAANPGLRPVALYHTGYTSVYAIGKNGDLYEFFLPAISSAWGDNDLTTNLSVPHTFVYPAPLVHYDTSGALTWTSVFTGDVGSGDLRESWLPAIGDNWLTQNLTTENPPATPPW
jgi:hypothetical protein